MNETLTFKSFMLGKDGHFIPVRLHVPSTAYINRKILHLSPVDAEFLLSQEMISKEEAGCILHYCFHEYLNREGKVASSPSVIDIIQFRSYAEINYLPLISGIFDASMEMMKVPLTKDDTAQFRSLQDYLYGFLKNNYVKISILDQLVDFRITADRWSEWLDIIKEVFRTKFGSSYHCNIVKEGERGYEALYCNVTFENLLNDEPDPSFAEVRIKSAKDGGIAYL